MCLSYERVVVEVHQALLSRLPLPEVLDETLHATHGIENMLTPSLMKKRKESRMTLWSVVLLEQEKQMKLENTTHSRLQLPRDVIRSGRLQGLRKLESINQIVHILELAKPVQHSMTTVRC